MECCQLDWDPAMTWGHFGQRAFGITVPFPAGEWYDEVPIMSHSATFQRQLPGKRINQKIIHFHALLN